MAFYAGRVILHPAMANPTIVVLTDRNDLDDQLFGTFARCRDLLAPAAGAGRRPRRPAREARRRLRRRGLHHDPEVLPRGEGRPAPGALGAAQHRRHRRRGAPQPVRLHRRLRAPHARRAAATPRSSASPARRSRRPTPTRAPCSATTSASTTSSAPSSTARRCPIYYESRLAKLELKESERPKIDPEFEEATEGEEVERKEKLKSKWAQLEAVVGSENRHQARSPATWWSTSRTGSTRWTARRWSWCMSRRIGVELYREIVALRPDWHGEDDEQGALKVVMTGSASDPLDWQPHIRNKPRREALADALPRSRRTRSRSSSCATCGSPASTRRACTRCTSTSRCAGTG